MTYQEWDQNNRNNIIKAFNNLNMVATNIEQTHPNGEYVTQTNPVNDNVLFTSGYIHSIEDQLKTHDLYLHAWVVYPEYISFIIKKWEE